MAAMLELKVGKTDPKLAFSNRVYLSGIKFQALKSVAKSDIAISPSDPAINVLVDNKFVFLASVADSAPDGDIAMNLVQRKNCNLEVGKVVAVKPFYPGAEVALSSLTIAVDLLIKKEGVKVSLDAEELATAFRGTFANQIFKAKQGLAMDFGDSGVKLDLTIDSFDFAAVGAGSGNSDFGHVRSTTTVIFKKKQGSTSGLIITGGELAESKQDLFRSDFNFASMGIGGLDEQFKEIFRKAFASRMFPGVAKQLGTNHVRGILLYGPPGCGKTLIARQIGKILRAKEPKIVNGPEILDKYVGGSEEKIRALFADAEEDQARSGDASDLHIIILDEMDAIMKTRGSGRGDSGVGDSIVNQFLSKIDGVDSLNNILLIGMTNRKDMIDEAILRPGRLEVHIEISLPDTFGRQQILTIKTADMVKYKRITEEALEKLPYLAQETKNFTGAELEGLVRNAASFALSRQIDPLKLNDPSNKGKVVASTPADLKVEWLDFERALQETVPAFGNKDSSELQSYYATNGLVSYGSTFDSLMDGLHRLVAQVRSSPRTPLLSLLLEGRIGSGKTAIAAKLAFESGYPFIRMISPDSFIGESEATKCNRLLKIFMDSYRSPLSIIFLDDIERLIEYTPVGMRFSNSVLQTLLILLRKVPPKGCRLLVIATTSIASSLEDLQLTSAFNVMLTVPQLESTSEYATILAKYAMGLTSMEVHSIVQVMKYKPLGVKQLIMVLEMAQSSDDDDEGTGAMTKVTPQRFYECLTTMGFV